MTMTQTSTDLEPRADTQPPVRPDLVSSLIAHKGNLNVAAEKLGVPVDHIVQALEGQDPAEQMRIALLWHIFEITSDVKTMIGASLGDFSPGELQRLYSDLLTQMRELIKPKGDNGGMQANQFNFNFGSAEAARDQLSHRLQAATRTVDVTIPGPATDAYSEPAAGDSVSDSVRLDDLGT